MILIPSLTITHHTLLLVLVDILIASLLRVEHVRHLREVIRIKYFIIGNVVGQLFEFHDNLLHVLNILIQLFLETILGRRLGDRRVAIILVESLG